MTGQKKSPTRKLLIAGGLFIAVFGLGAVLAQTMGWIGGEAPAKNVETADARLKTITQIVSASGKIQPEVEVILRPEVSGEITALPVLEGDYVEKGDLLVRLRPDIYESQVEETNASLLQQKANMEQARANLLEAEATFEQDKTLYERGAISEAEFRQSKTNYQAQQANFEAMKYQVQSTEARLRQAREELQKTTIRAPREGTISKLAVEVGERVLGNLQAQGTELLRIAKMNQMEVRVQVNENDIVNVSVNDTARIEVDAYPERVFDGVVTEIANSAEVTGEGTNEQVTNYEVKIRVATPHNLDMAGGENIFQQVSQELPDMFTPSFKPGMSATVDIETETVNNVVSVPIQAVTVRDFAQDREPGGGATDTADADTSSVKEAEEDDLIIPEEDFRKVVFVVEDGIVRRREVETGISDRSHIHIMSGLETGEEVVVGSYRVLSGELADGDKVTVNNNPAGRLTATNN